jgi:hypothetical protein
MSRRRQILDAFVIPFPVKQLTRIKIESSTDLGMPGSGVETAPLALLTSAGERSPSPADESVFGYRDAAVKISQTVVNSVDTVLLPARLADTSVQIWQNALHRAAN